MGYAADSYGHIDLDRPNRPRPAPVIRDRRRHFLARAEPHKTSKWSKLAREGHDIAWEFGTNRRYTGRTLIDGELCTPVEATKKFMKPNARESGPGE